jgi:HEAT repeat protein
MLGAVVPDSRRIAEGLGIREGEAARTARLFAFIFLMTASIVLAKSAQRGIFLAAYPRSAIPDAFLLSALVLAVTSLCISALAARINLKWLVQVLLAAGAVLVAAAAVAVKSGGRWAPMATYVLVDALSSLLLVQGWSVTTEALDVRSSKRLLPLVSVGAGLAWTAGGLSVPELVKWIGAPALLMCVPGVLLAALVALEVVSRFDLKARDADPPQRPAGFFGGAVQSLKYIFSEPLMRVLAAIITLDLLIEQVTDFQLFSVSQEHFSAAPGQIAGFMGAFYGVTGAVTLIAPFTFSGRVLTRLGSSRSAALAAVWVLLLSALFVAQPSFALIVLIAGGDRVLKQSLSSPARTQILGAIPAVRRAQAGAVLRGILASAFAVVGAAVLKLLQHELPVRWMSIATAVMAVILLGVILGYLRRGYVIALQRTVDKRRLDLDAPGESHLRQLDREQVGLLTEELKSLDPDRAAFAITMLANGQPALARPLLVQALSHPAAEIQAQAVHVLSSFGQPADAAPIAAALERSPNTAVRCACLRALATLGAMECTRTVQRFVTSAEPRERALARACLTKFEDAQAIRSGPRRADFESMLRSSVEAERAAAAWAMGRVQLAYDQMRDSFAPLLTDSSIAVRREAVGAAGWFTDLPIVRGLVLALGEQAVAPAAYDAFAQLADDGVQSVEVVLRDASASVISRTASALSRGAGDRSVDLLTRLLGHEDASVRYRAARSLIVRRRSRTAWRPAADVLLRAIQAELEQGYRYYATLFALAEANVSAPVTDEGTRRFVQGEIRSRIQQTEERLLSLIAVTSDRRVARLSHSLKDASPQTVARVIELLEQSIDVELAKLVVPFIEPQSAEARAKTASERFNVPAQYLRDPVVGIIDLNDEHLRRCALLAWRERMTAEYPSVADREQPLLHLVERIRFLRSVPLFKDLTPEDLMKLAEIAEPEEYVAGRTIFKKGDPGDVLCIVVRGRVEIRDGNRVIASQRPHEFFGELAVLDHEPRSADAVCAEDTELLQIGGPDLEELMERRPEIAREIIRVLARRLRTTTQTMLGQGQAPPAEPPLAVAR